MYRGSIVLLSAAALIVSGVFVGCGPAKGIAEWHLERGVELSEQGLYDGAIAECNTAIELDPDLAMAYNSRGCAYGDLGQFERAIEDLDQAIRLKPEFTEAYYSRRVAYRTLGRKEEAISDFEKSITLTDDRQWTRMARQQIDELED